MARLPKFLAASLLLAVSACTSLGQGNGCNTLSLPVAVRDAKGFPVDSLFPADFELKIKGKKVDISSVTDGPTPRRIVLMLDTSGSMKGPTGLGDWKLAVDILNQFATAFSPHSRLAFLAFDETVHNRIDFSQGNEAVLSQLKNMKDGNGYSKEIHGRTALFDAIHNAGQLFENPSPADVIFVVTDGGDNKSKLRQEGLERELLQTGVRFFAVILLDSQLGYRSRTPEELNGPQTLNELARVTGGEVFGPVGYDSRNHIYFSPAKYADSKDARIERALMLFYEGLFHLKVLKFELPIIPNKKDAKLDLKLSEPAQHKWKEASVSYPNQILLCDAKVH